MSIDSDAVDELILGGHMVCYNPRIWNCPLYLWEEGRKDEIDRLACDGD